MKKLSFGLLGLLFLTLTRLNGQTWHPQYLDGSLYVKVQQEMPIDLPTWQEGEIPAMNPFFSELEALCRRHQVTRLKKFGILPDPYLQKVYRLYFEDIAGTEALFNGLQALPYVELVELKTLERLVGFANDYNLSSPSGLASSYHLDVLSARDAWDYTLGCSNVPIAVVDNGIRYQHQDLQANVYTPPGEIAGNGIDDDLNGFVDDVNGWDAADNDNNPTPPIFSTGDWNHGTHCSGIAAGVTNNGVGIASISYNCPLIPVKVTGDNVSNAMTVTHGYEGIQYAVAAGAKVISLSWGGEQGSGIQQSVINAALSRGAVVVAAAGNDGVDKTQYPAQYNGVIAVGAVDVDGRSKSSYSNFGSWIDVMAPGLIYSTANGQNTLYNYSTGTSMACPLVAGLCGLILCENPALTPAEVETILKNSATNIDANNTTRCASADCAGKLGSGTVNALRALQAARPRRCNPDTLTAHLNNNLTANYTSLGYPGGNDGLNSTIKAQRFTGYKGYNQVKALSIRFASVTNTSGSGNVTVYVFGGNADNSVPGSNLRSVTVSLSQIAADVAAGRETYIVLNPVVEVRGTFFAGISIPTGGDSVALAIADPALATSSAALARVGSTWTSLQTQFGIPVNLAIRPVMTTPEAEGGATITAPPTTTTGVATAFSTPDNGTRYFWTFPGGVIRQGKSVSFIFLNPGLQEVRLQVVNDNCYAYDTFYIQVDAATSNDPNLNRSTLTLYPNPTQDYLYVSGLEANPGTATLRVLNLQGRTVWTGEPIVTTGAPAQLALGGLSSGLYILEVRTGNQTERLRFVKQ